MIKKQILDAFRLASQTLPFLAITMLFMGLAYTYGHILAPMPAEDSCEMLRLACNYLP